MSTIHLPAGFANSSSHSAEVRLQIVVDGQTLDLAKVGSTFALLSKPHRLKPGRADVLLHVDGNPCQWAVEILPHEEGDLRIPTRLLD